MAERNSLLNCRTGNGTAGSNPALSAKTKKLFEKSESFFCFWGEGSTKNSTKFKIQQKVVHEVKIVQERKDGPKRSTTTKRNQPKASKVIIFFKRLLVNTNSHLVKNEVALLTFYKNN